MNKRGTPENLVASHPGNQNALRHGVFSARAIQSRADEIELELLESVGEVSAVERLTIRELARATSLLERIDHHLDDSGLVDRRGKPHYLIDKRAALSRDLRFLRGEFKQIEEARAAQQKAAPDLPPRSPDRLVALAKAALEIALVNSDPEVEAALVKIGWTPPET